MRSLKECYEIAKKYHVYWAGNSGYYRYMCLAADLAYSRNELTHEEYTAIVDDAMSLVMSHSPDYSSLIEALGSAYGKEFTNEEVKVFWDKYLDNMENQDG